MLQETHWTPGTAPLWTSGVFHHASVVHSNARRGATWRTAGWSGGPRPCAPGIGATGRPSPG
eukprot:318705-Lingulodinium_polyedra.AAC.1